MVESVNGLQIAKLVMTTDVNNYKFYNMTQTDDENWTAEWGRISVTSTKKIYSMSAWNRVYKSKVKKGYVDQTDLYISESTQAVKRVRPTYTETFASNYIKNFVDNLRSYAKVKVEKSYEVKFEEVTLRRVERAQNLIDSIANRLSIGCDSYTINKTYLILIGIIQRRIRRVQDQLFKPISTQDELTEALEKIENEQSILDSMRGQVMSYNASTQPISTTSVSKPKNILEQLGLKIVDCDASDIAIIKRAMNYDSNKFIRAYKIENANTSEKYSDKIKTSPNKKTELFWHGSRNENWWNIIQTGLILRPANAVISGKMFGYGLYFADKFRKSFGYTSCTSAYWTSSNANKGILALFEVHVGNQQHIRHHASWCYDLTEKKLRNDGYDSLFAEGGIDLQNNEYIVYNETQCNIKYIVEVNS